jgi:hypothetical protein
MCSLQRTEKERKKGKKKERKKYAYLKMKNELGACGSCL